MKKFFMFVLVLAMSFMTLAGVSNYASAEFSQSQCDTVFMETINGLLDYENSEDTEITAEKRMVYDINLNSLGTLYLFNANNSDGYAIVIEDDGVYQTKEIYFDSANPYGDMDGLYIYVTTYVYWIYSNGAFIDVETGVELTADDIALASGVAYFSGGDYTSSSENVYYTYRSQSNYNMVYKHPGYYDYGLVSGCTPVAGGNIIGYYDRYFTDFIPNFTPITTLGSLVLYKAQNTDVQTMISSLYTYMGTDSNGTTVPMFIDGMTDFCTAKNRSIAFNTCMSGGSFSYSLATSRIDNGQPLVIFLDTFHIAEITENSGYDTISYLLNSGTHTLAGFGYKEITYTLSGGGTRHDYYIAVASGHSVRARGYLNINYNVGIDNAYGINIY